MKMTDKDLDRVDTLHDEIDDLLVGEDFSVCLHALCASIAGAGIHVAMDAKRRASKQEFMAQLHECISSWYDHYDALLKEKD